MMMMSAFHSRYEPDAPFGGSAERLAPDDTGGPDGVYGHGSGNAQDARDPESIRAMALALDQAWDGLPEDVERGPEARRWLAGVILDHFLWGERDSARLCELALAEIYRSRQEFASFDAA